MGVILLPVVEVMWVECSGECETSFVGEESILKRKFHLRVLATVTNMQAVHEGGIRAGTLSENGKDVDGSL